MATQVQNRRGSTAEHSTFTGAVGEVTVDTDKDVVVVHDGTTAGGYPQMRENGSNSALALGSAATPSLKFTGDTNTGIYSPGADQVAISTGSSERIRIGANGEIGLGGANYGTNGQVLTSAGSGAAPTWQTLSVSANSITQGDTNATVTDTGSDGRFVVTTEGSERLRVDSSGRLGIGTTSPQAPLDISASGSGIKTVLNIKGSASTTGDGGAITFSNLDPASFQLAKIASAFEGGTFSGSLRFYTNTNNDGANLPERMRIDSAGRLLVGTSSSTSVSGVGYVGKVQIANSGNAGLGLHGFYNSAPYGADILFTKSNSNTIGTNTLVASGDELGAIWWAGANGTGYDRAASIKAEVDGTPGASNDMPGRLVFSTTADGASSPTERMRIANGGDIIFVKSSTSTTTRGSYIQAISGAFVSAQPDNGSSAAFYATSTGNLIGEIRHTTTATSYVTSSDYRLKENITAVTDSITRLQQLKPIRFSFIADPAKTVDGFIAHEVQAVVPEAITGEKDEVDADGNPIYQGIDQSKLVPLLTAALQEAVAKIESLEARLTAAGI